MNGAKRREESCTGRYLRGLRNENGKHLLNLWIKHSRNTKITHHRVIGDGCIWEGISLVNVSRMNESVSVLKF